MVFSSRLRCLQHGDSWHNNFVFHKARDVVKVAIVDWQVGYTFASMMFASSIRIAIAN